MFPPTGLDVLIHRSSYPIAGSTVPQILRVMQALGPTRDGRSYNAYTDWTVDWAFDMEMVTTRARVGRVSVTVNVEVILPRWRPTRSALPELIVEWNRYLQAVEFHEQGHINLAVEAGRQILIGLERLDDASGSDTLRQQAKAQTDVWLSEARERDLRYDQESQHGALQGAVLRAVGLP